ncbi:MAG: hypothetical protein FJ167_10330 [Gammaproteobacteria bacterium]|nr:hypothetical protein [Gammaproteobacteria bacterium]
MNARTRSLTLTGVTGVVFVAHSVWVVVGGVYAILGWLSWFAYFGVGLLSWFAVRGALSLGERAVSEVARSTLANGTNEAE